MISNNQRKPSGYKVEINIDVDSDRLVELFSYATATAMFFFLFVVGLNMLSGGLSSPTLGNVEVHDSTMPNDATTDSN